MSKRRWDYVAERLSSDPLFAEKQTSDLKTRNPEWDKQIQKMKSFVAEDYHSYFITFQYLGVTGAKVHTDIEVKTIEFNRKTNEIIIDTWKMGIVILIEFEIWFFKDCYNAPESAEDMANVVYHKI